MSFHKIKSRELELVKYVILGSNNEVLLATNLKTTLFTGLKDILTDYYSYCIECNEDNISNIMFWNQKIQDLSECVSLEELTSDISDYGLCIFKNY